MVDFECYYKSVFASSTILKFLKNYRILVLQAIGKEIILEKKDVTSITTRISCT